MTTHETEVTPPIVTPEQIQQALGHTPDFHVIVFEVAGRIKEGDTPEAVQETLARQAAVSSALRDGIAIAKARQDQVLNMTGGIKPPRNAITQ